MEATATPQPLRFARHIVGMMILAAVNPLIYYDPAPLFMWISGWIGPLIAAGLLFGLYALFLTARAKQDWPSRYFMLAWVLAALVALGGWGQYNELRSGAKRATAAPAQMQQAPAQQGQPVAPQTIDWEKGVMTPPQTNARP